MVCGLTKTRLPSISSVCGGRFGSRSRSSAVQPPSGGIGQPGVDAFGATLISAPMGRSLASPFRLSAGNGQVSHARGNDARVLDQGRAGGLWITPGLSARPPIVDAVVEGRRTGDGRWAGRV